MTRAAPAFATVFADTYAEDIERLSDTHQAAFAAASFIASGTAGYEWVAESGALRWFGRPEILFGLDPQSTLFTRAALDDLRRDGRTGFALEGFEDGECPYEDEFEIRRADGSYQWVEDRGVMFAGEDGRPMRAIGTLRLIGMRKEREGDLAFRAEFDELTGQMNRARLRDAIDAAIARQRGQGDAALLLASIDGLSAINESYGFRIADAVIAETARRIVLALGARDAVGRAGGNKLGVVIADCAPDALEAAAHRLRDAVQAQMVETAAGPVAATISVGAILLPAGADSAEVALMRAEDALGRAKQSGRSSLAIYDASPQREAARRKRTEAGAMILEALRENRFRLAYQPIACTRSGRIESYEALIRLTDSRGTVVPAADFIPFAEELGLVREIDRRVLELAADALRRAPALKIGVNVSGLSVGDPAWLKTFDARLACDRALASRLTVEVTETAALHDISEGVRFVRRLRAAGCRVAIDDFGAGYTSFRNLQTLDINSVKIDGTFVKGLAARPDNQAFVRTLVTLARTFALETVAEWVGTAEEATLLRAFGVEYVQGAFVGMPELTPPWDQGRTG